MLPCHTVIFVSAVPVLLQWHHPVLHYIAVTVTVGAPASQQDPYWMLYNQWHHAWASTSNTMGKYTKSGSDLSPPPPPHLPPKAFCSACVKQVTWQQDISSTRAKTLSDFVLQALRFDVLSVCSFFFFSVLRQCLHRKYGGKTTKLPWMKHFYIEYDWSTARSYKRKIVFA